MKSCPHFNPDSSSKIGIHTSSVTPGLVGGHCIGVDPYYLIHRAKELGVESRIIAAGRAVNDGMAKHVAENTVKSLIKANKRVKGAKVAVLGITFKQDCSDTRNTKVIDIVNELKEYDMNVIIADPVANVDEVREEYEVELIDINNIFNVDVIILAVAHNEYRKMSVNDFSKLYKQQLVLDEVAVDSNISLCEKNVFIDIKGIVSRKSINVEEFVYWRL